MDGVRGIHRLLLADTNAIQFCRGEHITEEGGLKGWTQGSKVGQNTVGGNMRELKG